MAARPALAAGTCARWPLAPPGGRVTCSQECQGRPVTPPRGLDRPPGPARRCPHRPGRRPRRVVPVPGRSARPRARSGARARRGGGPCGCCRAGRTRAGGSACRRAARRAGRRTGRPGSGPAAAPAARTAAGRSTSSPWWRQGRAVTTAMPPGRSSVLAAGQDLGEPGEHVIQAVVGQVGRVVAVAVVVLLDPAAAVRAARRGPGRGRWARTAGR